MLLTENLSTVPVLKRRVMQKVVTISAVVPLTGFGLNGVVGAVVLVTVLLVPALGLSQDHATIPLLLVVAGKHLALTSALFCARAPSFLSSISRIHEMHLVR